MNQFLKAFASFATATLLMACSDTERFEPSTSSGAYCVPTVNLVDAPVWVRSADFAKNGGGFAYSACSVRNVDCNAPIWLLGGVVEPNGSTVFGRSSREIDRDGGSLAADLHHAYRVNSFDGSELLSVEARGAFGNIYVFNKHWGLPTTSASEAVVSADDVLVASCQRLGQRPPIFPSESGHQFSCRRAFMRDGLLFQYQFSTDSISSLRDFERKDESVYSFIAQWKCE